MSEELANTFEEPPFATESLPVIHSAPIALEPRPATGATFRLRPAPDRRQVDMPIRPYAERRASLR